MLRIWRAGHWMRGLRRRERFTCPRRREMGALAPNATDEDSWGRDGTCSYCGSISPSKFFAAVEAGREIGPTDKSYKAYVEGELGDPVTRGKFYFQHLGEDGYRRFISLYNANQMNLGYPFYFYVRPFFARQVAA